VAERLSHNSDSEKAAAKQNNCSNRSCSLGYAHSGPCDGRAVGMDRDGRFGLTEEEKAKHDKRQELTTWWYTQAQKEIEGVIDKAIEYGAADLKVMGTAMLRLMKDGDNQPERVGLELAVAFYALGKVARLFGAYERGELPSDDCWADLGIYCRMAQHIREAGRWP
jgi:hypothetical protein